MPVSILFIFRLIEYGKTEIDFWLLFFSRVKILLIPDIFFLWIRYPFYITTIIPKNHVLCDYVVSFELYVVCLDLFVTESKLQVLPCLDGPVVGALVEHCNTLVLFMINSMMNNSIYFPVKSLYKVLSIIIKACYNKSCLFSLLRPYIFLIAGIFFIVHVQFFIKILQ